MSEESIPHIPVLLNEVLESFDNLEGTLIDCTLGFAGHTFNLLEKNPNLKIIALDKDTDALAFAKKRLSKFSERVEFINTSFAKYMSELSPDDTSDIRGVLADIGVSSFQLDNMDRGFSFDSEKLDMRMDKSALLDAKQVVNRYTEFDLARIFKEYGELREAKKLARFICEERGKSEITTAKELSSIINRAMHKTKGINVATLPFQAIRIEVNKELEELETLLANMQKFTNCTFGIISFHSLEDRMIKNAFKEASKKEVDSDDGWKSVPNPNYLGEVITKKPLTASDKELKSNPRARSAKLRVFKIK